MLFFQNKKNIFLWSFITKYKITFKNNIIRKIGIWELELKKNLGIYSQSSVNNLSKLKKI